MSTAFLRLNLSQDHLQRVLEGPTNVHFIIFGGGRRRGGRRHCDRRFLPCHRHLEREKLILSSLSALPDNGDDACSPFLLEELGLEPMLLLPGGFPHDNDDGFDVCGRMLRTEAAGIGIKGCDDDCREALTVGKDNVLGRRRASLASRIDDEQPIGVVVIVVAAQ